MDKVLVEATVCAQVERLEVTESDWLSCTDPKPMLEFLRGKASDRKLRLFAVACCRRIWHLLTDERSRTAVEVAERYADDKAFTNELRVARKRAMQVRTGNPSLVGAGAAAASSSYKSAFGAACDGCLHVLDAEARLPFNGDVPPSRVAFEAFLQNTVVLRQVACGLLREVVINPFRPVTINRTWLIPTVTDLARSIYDSRDFSGLPILADALEQAGCNQAELLGHCRGGGEHVRGCWAVDLVLKKE